MKIPKAIWSMSGPPIPVVLKDDLRQDKSALGMWLTAEREIRLASDLRRDVQVTTLLHEMTHVALIDAGVSNVLDGRAA